MNNLPATRSERWLLWMLIYGLLFSLLLLINRFVVIGQTFDIGFALRFVLLAFVVSGVVNGFGWLGAKYIWMITTLGLVIGLGLMYFYSARDLTGWEDLASILGLMEGLLIGFVVGVLVEGVYLIMKGRRRSNIK
ncbi:MAG: hypothetical protein H7X86_13160 [Gorillibacterium sp.]|nr:hypothetical protein [Gorillibacterium sp.]